MGSLKPVLLVEGRPYYRETDVAIELTKRELHQVRAPAELPKSTAWNAVQSQAVGPAMAEYHDASGVGDVYFTYGAERFVNKEAVALLEMEAHEKMLAINSGPGFYVENQKNQYLDSTTFRLTPTRQQKAGKKRALPSPTTGDELTQRTAPKAAEEKSAELNKMLNDIMNLTKSGTPPSRNVAAELQATKTPDWNRHSLSQRTHR